MAKKNGSVQYAYKVYVCVGDCVIGCVQMCRVCVYVCACFRSTPDAQDCFDFPLHGERESNLLRIPPLEVFSCHKPPFSRQNPTRAFCSLMVLMDDWGGEKA